MPKKKASKLTAEQLKLFNKISTFNQPIVLGMAQGLDNLGAYRKSTGKAKDNSALIHVSKLRKNVDVIAFLHSMKSQMISDSILSKEDGLVELSNIVKSGAKPTEKVAAIRTMADLQGWNAPSRQQIEIPKGVTHKYSADDYKEADEKIDDHFSS